MQHKSDGHTIRYWWTRYSHQRISTGIGKLENKKTRGDYSNYSIVKIAQNTEKSPGDLRRLSATKTPVEDHRLMLVWKEVWW